MDKKPQLTISIPTYNRSKYLAETLMQINSELSGSERGEVEIVVSDNASLDETESVVKVFIKAGLQLRYIRNKKNIGSDANIAQCFNLAQGRYVLILGDDDLFIDGAIAKLLDQLKADKFGVVCVKPYGFDRDFRSEYPGNSDSNQHYDRAGNFLADIGPLMTLISGCVINKSILSAVDANNYCGENLVQVHLVIQAAVKAKQNLFMNHYMIGCKRNNSGGYDFAKVFVENFGVILDSYVGNGLTKKDVRKIELKFIISYFPFYLMKQRFYKLGNLDEAFARFYKRYGNRLAFYFWLYPILKAPRWIAISWGVITTFLGRVLNGDLIRGISFAVNKLKIIGKQ